LYCGGEALQGIAVRRSLDIILSFAGLVVLGIPLTIILFLVWRQDGHSPFYVADRAGRGGRPFKMIKVRSMIVGADQSGVESTSAADNRITKLGHFIRRWKIDELSQLWNVLKGDMSLVGPRPNTLGEVTTYSELELGLLSVRPGITDFSSVVFSDEGDILRGSADPDADYSRLIRPWKSQLGLLYVQNASLVLNIQLIWLTLLGIFDKPLALSKLSYLLTQNGASPTLSEVSLRTNPLENYCHGALQ
jgi:lipopolysaccharide/colanic/teichoic acid biosynthesis glycosyltransferase